MPLHLTTYARNLKSRTPPVVAEGVQEMVCRSNPISEWPCVAASNVKRIYIAGPLQSTPDIATPGTRPPQSNRDAQDRPGLTRPSLEAMRRGVTAPVMSRKPAHPGRARSQLDKIRSAAIAGHEWTPKPEAPIRGLTLREGLAGAGVWPRS